VWALSDAFVWRLSVAYIAPKSRTERPRKTKIDTKVAHVTRTPLSRSMVKVTRPLYSPPCWRIRRLQRWAREPVGRGKPLLRCRLLGGGRRFGAHEGRRGVGAYRGGRPPTACLWYGIVAAVVINVTGANKHWFKVFTKTQQLYYTSLVHHTTQNKK